MKGTKITNFEKKYLSKKASLAYFTILKYTIDKCIINDPIIKIDISYNDIKAIINLKEVNIYRFFYFNVEKIHEKLYDEEEKINVDIGIEKGISFYYYLNLLITNDKSIVNYTYSINLIKEMNELQKNNKDKIYKKLILSKIIIDLINNYKKDDIYEEEEEEILNKIEKDNNNIIEKNVNFFTEIHFELPKNDIGLDDLYIKLIISLLKSNKFYDNEYMIDIMEQLDFENINITKKMYEELFIFLKNSEKYKILDKNDFISEEIIYFYYILFKYILKDPIYIYNIELLLISRKNLLKLLKNNGKESIINKIKDDNTKEKFLYIFDFITDSKYYSKPKKNNKSWTIKTASTNIISTLNSYFHKKTKKELQEISKYNSVLKQSKNNIVLKPKIKKYSFDNYKYITEKNKEKKSQSNNKLTSLSYFKGEKQSEVSSVNLGSNISYSFTNIKIFLENIFKNLQYPILINVISKELHLEEKELNFNSYKKKINSYKKEELEKDDIIIYDSFKKLEKFINKIKEEIVRQITEIFDNIYIELTLNFTGKEEKGKGDFKNITCNYDIKSTSFLFNQNYQDEDVLNNENNIENFKSLFNNIKTSLSSIRISNNSSSNQTLKDINNNLVIYTVKKIGYHKKGGANYIKQLNNNLLISGDNKTIFFYDINSYKKVHETKIENDYVCEIKDNDKTNNLNLVICSDKINKINNLSIKKNKDNFYDYRLETLRIGMKTRVCFKIGKDFILADDKDLFLINDLLSTQTLNKEKRNNINKSFWTGIKINSELIALTSNEIIPNGEDIIIFYNFRSKRVNSKVENYSFSLSHNNLALMPKDINKPQKILLCACKKYNEKQKNGILLLILNLENNAFEILSSKFYETQNLEIYCFCPIYLFEKNHYILQNTQDNIAEETTYFLVGGFNQVNKKGFVHLYKVNYNNEIFENTEIEFVRDLEKELNNNVELKQCGGFKNIITCITQQINSEEIKLLVTCFDGNVFLITYKNLEVLILNELNL